MKDRGNISTKTSTRALIFTIIGLVASIVVITLCAIFGQGQALAYVAIVFFSIIAICAVFVIFGLTLDFAYIKDEVLFMQYIFKSSKIKVRDIKEIKLEKGVYSIIDKHNNVAGTINAAAEGADKIIVYLDQKGVHTK